ncbi:MAG: hypothetical protein WA210_08830 [Burkholderiaceae bacterium]
MTRRRAGVDDVHLRERLMATQPMQRVAALHDLECELVRSAHPPSAQLAQAIQEFVARGMPFYSNVDPHYLAWVDRAVDYWERLQRAGVAEPAAASARAQGRAARSVIA